MKIYLLAVLFASFGASATEGKFILFLGDSYMAGHLAEKPFPYLVKDLLQKKGHRNLEILNAARAGLRSDLALTTLQTFLLTEPDIIVIAFGANEFFAENGEMKSDFQKNLHELVARCSKTKAKLVVLKVPLPPKIGPTLTARYENLGTDLSKSFKSVYEHTLLSNISEQKDNLASDGYHLNQKGHELAAQSLSEILARQL